MALAQAAVVGRGRHDEAYVKLLLGSQPPALRVQQFLDRLFGRFLGQFLELGRQPASPLGMDRLDQDRGFQLGACLPRHFHDEVLFYSGLLLSCLRAQAALRVKRDALHVFAEECGELLGVSQVVIFSVG